MLLRSGVARPSHLQQIVTHHGTSVLHSPVRTLAGASTAVNAFIKVTDRYLLTNVDG
jgi:hypothetical protein